MDKAGQDKHAAERAAFAQLIADLSEQIGARPLNASLEQHLNETLGPASDAFRAIEAACKQGVREGWMCNREGGGIRYGRVIKPSPQTRGYSVDVVDMDRIKGPHHAHPNGEIDMVMPLEGNADFDGQPAGWKVYEPGSAHYPTVNNGRALVLYLLPDGAIEFTRA